MVFFLELIRMEDWYKVSHQALRSIPGGTSLLAHYRDSPSAVIMGAFQNHQWNIWEFKGCPTYAFDDSAVVHRYFKSLELPLRIFFLVLLDFLLFY